MSDRLPKTETLLHEEIAYPDRLSSVMAGAIALTSWVFAWLTFRDDFLFGALLCFAFGSYILQGVVRWWFMSSDELPFVRLYDARIAWGGPMVDARSIAIPEIAEISYWDTVDFPFFTFCLMNGELVRLASPFSHLRAKRLYSALGARLSVPMRYNGVEARTI
jgi:hypothetical protein